MLRVEWYCYFLFEADVAVSKSCAMDQREALREWLH
jgi:hypothetical protein